MNQLIFKFHVHAYSMRLLQKHAAAVAGNPINYCTQQLLFTSHAQPQQQQQQQQRQGSS